jgi:general secretion pathway protein E
MKISDTQVDVFWCERSDPNSLAEISRLHRGLRFHFITESELVAKILKVYSVDDSNVAQVVGDIEQEVDISRLLEEIPEIEDLVDSDDQAPVIRMVNALLGQAVRDGASDIHIESFEARSVVRFRVDGSMRTIVNPHKALHAALISRIKIMAQLDIAEKRLPQDGRISLRVGGRIVDLRVSTLPAIHGERIVMRLLEKNAGGLSLSELGMADDHLKKFRQLLRQPHGIILITGPTGSGKTTTIYSALMEFDTAAINIMTVEDPVEYDLDGIGQIQVNSRIEMSFAKALRAILRQDPDVIFIGEIRDIETARIAVQASLTGHLVLATMHTNDAPAAVTRLLDMGVDDFLISSSLLCVVAQRLVRKLCDDCKRYNIEKSYYQPVGCIHCAQTGFRRRTSLHELLVIDEALRPLIRGGEAETALKAAAKAGGMRTMRDDGARIVAAGETSIEEVVRSTGDDLVVED